ncbi:MAG: XRE family transcriptional regulator [Chloroflexota bacterium]|nr:MAG: XRE family transcriptional regulator [Chloroflexota bacterium]
MSRQDKPVAPPESGVLPIGARMRLARQGKPISLTNMAKRLGYTKGHLSAVENLTTRPSLELVRKYERELELEAGQLLRAQTDQQPALGHRHAPKDLWERLEELEEREETQGYSIDARLDEIKKLLDNIWRAPHTTPDSLALLTRFLEAGLREISSGEK